jgi:hypothetical protein
MWASWFSKPIRLGRQSGQYDAEIDQKDRKNVNPCTDPIEYSDRSRSRNVQAISKNYRKSGQVALKIILAVFARGGKFIAD